MCRRSKGDKPSEFGVVSVNGLRKRARWQFLGVPPKYNAIHKPAIMRPDSRTYYSSSHQVSLRFSSSMLLPIRHYKFHGDIIKRAEKAATEGMHPNGSREYRDMLNLTRKMIEKSGYFRGSCSRQYRSFTDFCHANISVGLD